MRFISHHLAKTSYSGQLNLITPPSPKVYSENQRESTKKTPNVLSVPTLSQIALVNTTITLWKFHFHPDTLVSDGPWEEKKWKLIAEKVDALTLPKRFKQKLKHEFVRNIGSELITWLRLLNVYIAPELGTAQLLLSTRLSRWTSHGKIDQKESARTLSLCEELSPIFRLVAACNFCLTDRVTEISSQFGEKEIQELDSYYFMDWPISIVEFWIDFVESKCEFFDADSEDSFLLMQKAACSGNVCAVKFFLGFTMEEDREEAIVSVIEKIPDVCLRNKDVVYYLLSRINKGLLEDVVQSIRDKAFFRKFVADWVYSDWVDSKINF